MALQQPNDLYPTPAPSANTPWLLLDAQPCPRVFQGGDDWRQWAQGPNPVFGVFDRFIEFALALQR
jgi:hypothetical protein